MRFYPVFRFETYWISNAVGNVRGLPKWMHLSLHWDVQGLAVHSQFPHHTVSATDSPGWWGMAQSVGCAADYYSCFKIIKMLSSGKQRDFAPYSLPASTVIVCALCSFREYYNAAVTCTRCLTPFLLQTPSNQNLLWQVSHVHNLKLTAKASYANWPTCNCGAEEEHRSTGQGSGHFCLAMGILSQPLARNESERHKWPCDGDLTSLSLENFLPGSSDDYRFLQAQEPEKHRCLSNQCLFYAVALQIPLTQ